MWCDRDKIKERSSQNHTNRAGKEKNVFLAEELKPIERKLGICFDRTDIETMLLIIEKKRVYKVYKTRRELFEPQELNSPAFLLVYTVKKDSV